MSELIIDSAPLGMQWPGIDPFLFCVHHDDAYPAGNEQFGPAASLEGRQMGSDFEGIDGWRMYHGEVVPGFPGHPHRGFETVTFVRHGLIDHSDSLGAAARFGRGDTQWLTAGAGVVHSEMFPLLDREGPNRLELFQIWLNLPAEDKMVDPYFTMLWADDIPTVTFGDEGRAVDVTVIAGRLDDATPPPPPPSSWASRADGDVAIWNLRLDAGASWTMPAARSDATIRALYLYEGGSFAVDGRRFEGPTVVVARGGSPLPIEAGDEPTQVLLLQGRPIGQPVAQYGPFVMNDEAGIRKAMEDYRRTGFGGWPWPDDAPVHGGPEQGRFARHVDGRVEEPDADRTADRSTTAPTGS